MFRPARPNGPNGPNGQQTVGQSRERLKQTIRNQLIKLMMPLNGAVYSGYGTKFSAILVHRGISSGCICNASLIQLSGIRNPHTALYNLGMFPECFT